MPVSANLLRKYQQIIAEPLRNDLDETVSLLCSTDWVRILIVRDSQGADVCSIEVEVSMPPCIIDPSSAESNQQQAPATRVIKQTISHLEYLLKLKDSGFLLGILSTECIWSASLEVHDCPDAGLFKVLIPPC
jgi:hypothetical protein